MNAKTMDGLRAAGDRFRKAVKAQAPKVEERDRDGLVLQADCSAAWSCGYDEAGERLRLLGVSPVNVGEKAEPLYSAEEIAEAVEAFEKRPAVVG